MSQRGAGRPALPGEADPLIDPRRQAGPGPVARGDWSVAEWLLRHKKPLILAGMTAAVATLIIVIGLYFSDQGNPAHAVRRLKAEVKVDDIFTHLRELEKIAKDHPSGSRSIANGFNASADYVVETILAEKVPCRPWKQHFKAPVWTEHAIGNLSVTYGGSNAIGGDGASAFPRSAPGELVVTYQGGVDFKSMRYGGQAGCVTNAAVVPVAQDGCGADDYPSDLEFVGAGPLKQAVALIEAGTNRSCTFFDAAYRAELKGFSAVVFYNHPRRSTLLGSRVRIVEWESGDPLMKIPVISMTHSLGSTLRKFAESKLASVRIDLQTHTSIEVHTTFNVLCEINGGPHGYASRTNHPSAAEVFDGTPAKSVVVGSHLDSVPFGPGMVDNASGSSTLLAILLAMNRIKFWGKRKVIFAWWGAEEVGLLGSRHYVRNLQKDGRISAIGAALNFDMLGSPNYTPQIHLGSTAPESVREQSIAIQKMFEADIEPGRKVSYDDMYGGSDFLPFLKAGVPAGGVLTGAGEIKTGEERTKYGGLANAPLDPCYHLDCDTVENVSREAIAVMSSAAAHGVGTLLNVDDLDAFLNGPG